MHTTSKKRFVTVITIITLALLFSMCMEFDSHASTKSVYKPIKKAYYNIYAMHYPAHTTAITAKQSGLTVEGFRFENDVLISDSYPGIGYAYYDINHDGVKDLIVGTVHNNKSPKNLKNVVIYSIWTQRNGKAKFVKSADYRCQLLITGRNKICYEMSGGYNYTLYKFYKLSGTTLKYTGKRVNGKWETNANIRLNWHWFI